MTAGKDELLIVALHAAVIALTDFPGVVAVDQLSLEPWASIDFTGEIRVLRVTFTGFRAVGAAATLLGRLDTVELALRDSILADFTLRCDARSDDGRFAMLELEAWTIDA